MIEESKLFYDAMAMLYECTHYVRYEIPFNQVMKSNKSRIGFINNILNSAIRGQLNEEELYYFNKFIGYVMNYMMKTPKNYVVPKENYEDMETSAIIPSTDELEELIKLIEANVDMYKGYYQDKEFVLSLPDNTFNMNMHRVLNVRYNNIPHLLGLTDSSQKENPSDNNNSLMKFYLKFIKKDESKPDAIGLLNWILSDDGKMTLTAINKKVIAFKENDIKKNPRAYDADGNLKKNSAKKFYERLNEEYKSLGISFPIIKYSRLKVKALNTLNFLNMNDITQVIMDYNSKLTPLKPGEKDDPTKDRRVRKDEKDIYIVNVSQKRLNDLTKSYLRKKRRLQKLILKAQTDPKALNKIVDIFKELDISKPKYDDFMNLVQNLEYFRKNNISMEDKQFTDIVDKLNKYLAQAYEQEIHFIGFGTDYDVDKDNNMVIHELSDVVVNKAHCDTSISTNIAELISDFYVRGRAFYIDQIRDTSTSKGVFRISTPKEELEYYAQMERMGIDCSLEKKPLLKSYKKCDKLFNIYRRIYGDNLDIKHPRRR